MATYYQFGFWSQICKVVKQGRIENTLVNVFYWIFFRSLTEIRKHPAM